MQDVCPSSSSPSASITESHLPTFDFFLSLLVSPSSFASRSDFLFLALLSLLIATYDNMPATMRPVITTHAPTAYDAFGVVGSELISVMFMPKIPVTRVIGEQRLQVR